MLFNDGAIPADFKPGDHVATHPACHAWLSGRRYGEVIKVGRKWVHIEVGSEDASSVIKIAPRNIAKVRVKPVE